MRMPGLGCVVQLLKVDPFATRRVTTPPSSEQQEGQQAHEWQRCCSCALLLWTFAKQNSARDIGAKGRMHAASIVIVHRYGSSLWFTNETRCQLTRKRGAIVTFSAGRAAFRTQIYCSGPTASVPDVSPIPVVTPQRHACHAPFLYPYRSVDSGCRDICCRKLRAGSERHCRTAERHGSPWRRLVATAPVCARGVRAAPGRPPRCTPVLPGSNRPPCSRLAVVRGKGLRPAGSAPRLAPVPAEPRGGGA